MKFEQLFGKQQTSADGAAPMLIAKWLPFAMSAVALAVSIGGHAFTGANTVALAGLTNKLEDIRDFKETTLAAGSQRDRQMQSLTDELSKREREIAALQEEVANLKSRPAAQTKAADVRTQFIELREQAEMEDKMARAEKNPLPNGVNEQFDNTIRHRVKRYWTEPEPQDFEGYHRLDSDVVTVLKIEVDRTGVIRTATVANTSGHLFFDESVVKAVLRMGSIPEIGRLPAEAYSRLASFRLAFSPYQLR